MLFDPQLVIAWECRQSVRALWRQYRRYGRGKAQVVRMHPQSAALRHFAAPGLVGMLALALVLAPFRRRWAFALVVPYTGLLTVATATVAPKLSGGATRRAVPRAFAAMHLGWGLGFWEGMAGLVARRQNENL